MATGDFYQLSLVHGYAGSESLRSVFHFSQTAGSGGATSLAAVFQGDVLPLIAAASGSGIDFDRLEIFSLFNTEDFIEFAPLVPAVGSIAGDMLPPQATMTIRFPTTNRAIRSGYKRFSGLVEQEQGNGIIAAPQIGRLNAIAAKLLTQLAGGVPSGTWEYVIIKRIKYTPSGGGTAFRLPQTPAELVYFRPTAGIVDNRVSSQNTRKLGRGI